ERPDRVLALCTPQAKRESWPVLEEALRGRYPVEKVDVPAGDAQADVNSYLAHVAGAIPGAQEVELTVDVTHGYRHFAFLTYIAVLYLAALRGIQVRGAYYGLLRHDSVSPFLDLRPLLALPRWLHALQALRDTGSASPMAMALCEGPQNQSARTIARELSQLSEGYLSGLPLELGQHARGFREQRLKPLRKLLAREHHIPLAAELVDQLTEILDPFILDQQVSGDGWKQHVALSKPELARQARIVDDLLQRESIATALGLLNEWTVSWVAWRLGYERGWLDFQVVRRRAAGLLGAIAAVSGDPDLHHVLSDEQRSLGDFWSLLCELRNAYHHHGMRAQVLVGNPQIAQKLQRVSAYWKAGLRCCPDFSLALGESTGGRLLVSPIGRRPGVLFSALQACRADDNGEPTMCLVICSMETEGLIAEAAGRADYTGTIEPLRLEDPYGGRPEIERLVKAARKHLVGMDDVLVNITGGTTLMGLTAEAVADAARKLARPVRRFGLIDRRPSEQQDTDPYQTGEPFWLESMEDVDANVD
ncbi:MAG: hypothetical protein JXA57_11350, partial [Armatimonadetes bacterium]|nr:hypothetical protein [Armatimonadota bacterium]